MSQSPPGDSLPDAANEPSTPLQSAEGASYWLSAIIESAEDAIISKTLDGLITSWNKAAERIFGYTAEEIVGRPVSVLIPPDHQDEEPSILARLRRGERIEHYETVRMRKDGSLVHVSLTVSPIRGAGGRIIGASKIARDISDRKRTEEALRRREEELTDFIENSAIGLHWVGSDGTILWANQAELDLLGYTREEYIGHRITEFHADSDVIDDILCRLTNKETLHDYEARLRCKDGSIRHVLINSNVLWEGDRFVHTRCFTRDITKRKRAEEELRESKRQLEELLSREQAARAEAERARDFTRHVLEDAPVAIGVMEGPDHRFVLVNRHTCELTGLTEGQFLGRPHAEVVPEADEVVGPILDRVYESGEGVTQEVAVDLPSGRRHLLVTWTALPGDDGRPGSVLYLSLDITSRKRAEEALRESTEQYQATFELAGVGIGHTAPDGRWLRVNQKLCDIIGYSCEELLGLTFRDITHPDYLEQDTEAARAMLRGERQSYTTEKRYIRKDGSEVWVNLTVSPLRDSAGALRYFISVIEDVSERKRAEEGLRESEAQLRTLADAVPQLAWMAHADGHIFWYNRRWYEYTGTTPEQMEGWGWQSVHDPEVLPRVLERWGASIESGEPFEMEFPLKGADGHFRSFLTRVVPLKDGRGRVLRWFGTNTDVEELRRALRHAEESNRLKDEFLATVSHELRTPLTAVLGWAHLLRSGQLDGVSAARALETIERNARSQTQLIEDLLDVSRIITGKLRLDVRPVDPGSLIESAIEALRPAAAAKGIRMQKVMDTGVISVAGDPARLQQVVWNLVSNAIKFTPKGGRVQIRLERINSHVEIVVSDTGAGIAPEFLPHVFDRFRQADQKTTRQHGGLGLGLAIVRHLVELHGGSVEAQSSGEGQGATFVVKLPIVSVYQTEGLAERVHPAAEDALPSYDCPERLDGIKVLVVDDEADTRELLRAGIGQCGAKVLTAGSAQEALEIIERERPHLLISDIGMPGEDGYELIRKVRALPAGSARRIPAIALTAYARTEDRLRALRAGYQMHMPKPVELIELVAIAASLIQRIDEDGPLRDSGKEE
jgi:PAS domain S-box-containing protein